MNRLFPVRVVRKFLDDGGGNQAVLIAWNALTAIFPIALALVAVGGLILGLAGISADSISKLVANLFPPDQQQTALDAINGVKQRSGLIGLIAFFGFLWVGSGLFGAMEGAFAIVYETDGRPFVRQKLMALAMMGLFTVLALVAVGSSTALAFLGQFPQLSGLAGAALGYAVSVLAGCLLFLVIYFVVPNRRQGLRNVWPGALFAGVAFNLLTLLFPIYIQINKGINQYGKTFAFLFIMLTFFYVFGLITMLGAEINAVLEEPQDDASATPHDQRP
ncbi:MAG TPA: YihY/virulence factor BrkB family protein [Gemmataceae bacterium]|nr:YihY/virulence factor BrkB family protein [Gemmataceae bacterium]